MARMFRVEWVKESKAKDGWLLVVGDENKRVEKVVSVGLRINSDEETVTLACSLTNAEYKAQAQGMITIPKGAILFMEELQEIPERGAPVCRAEGRGDGWVLRLPGIAGGTTIYVRGLTPRGVIKYTVDPDEAFLFSDRGFAQGLANLLAQAYPDSRLQRLEVPAYFDTRGEGE